MKSLHSKLILLPALSLLLGSCATIVTGTNAEIIINGQQEEPVTIKTFNNTYEGVMLPQTVKVQKKKLNETISVISEHYNYQSFIPGRKSNPWIFGNIVIGGLIGFGVDALTGGMYEAKMPIVELQATPKQPTDLPTSMEEGVE